MIMWFTIFIAIMFSIIIIFAMTYAIRSIRKDYKEVMRKEESKKTLKSKDD